MHLLAVGPTRVGKSNFGVWRSCQHMRDGIGFTFVLPHDPPADMLIAEVYARLKKSVAGRLIVEDAGDMSAVVMRPFVQFSSDGDYFSRKRDNRLYEERALEPCVSRLAEGAKLSDTPAKEKAAKLAIRIFQDVRKSGVFIPESQMHNILARDHPTQKTALKSCKDPELLAEMRSLLSLPHREYFSHVESAIRFLEPVYGSAIVEARTSVAATFDWPAFFRRGGIHIIRKGKASDDDFRTFVNADFLMKYRMAMDGLLPPHYYKIDEINNYALMDNFMATCLSTSGFKEFWLELYTQLLDFPSDRIKDIVLTNCAKVMFRQNHPDMQEFVARELRSLMDRDKIHHIEESKRQVHDGFDEVSRRSEGKTKLPGGKSTVSENVSKQLIAKYKEVTEQRAVYESSHEQVFWKAQDIGELDKGVCYYKPMYGPVEKLRIPLVEPSFFSHNIKRKIQECLDLIRTLPPYQKPAPPEPISTHSPKNATTAEMSFSTFIPLPPASSQPQGSTPQPRRRGRGSNGTKEST